MKWFIAMNFVADVELFLHRREKDTFTSSQQKKEFELHLTYIELMEVFNDIGFSQPGKTCR